MHIFEYCCVRCGMVWHGVVWCGASMLKEDKFQTELVLSMKILYILPVNKYTQLGKRGIKRVVHCLK